MGKQNTTIFCYSVFFSRNHIYIKIHAREISVCICALRPTVFVNDSFKFLTFQKLIHENRMYTVVERERSERKCVSGRVRIRASIAMVFVNGNDYIQIKKKKNKCFELFWSCILSRSSLAISFLRVYFCNFFLTFIVSLIDLINFSFPMHIIFLLEINSHSTILRMHRDSSIHFFTESFPVVLLLIFCLSHKLYMRLLWRYTHN